MIRQRLASTISAIAVTLGVAIAAFPVQSALADQWDYPYTIGSSTTLTYYAQSSVEGRLYTPIQNAMSGWNGISARRWGGPYRFDTSNSGDIGQIREYTSGWPYSSSYAGYTVFSTYNNLISSITTSLDSQYFYLNTGTTSSGTSISTQDAMVHELGFAVSLYEGCYGPNSTTPYSDTTANSAMCDINLVNNSTGPQSNDVLAVQYIYQ